MAEEVGLTRLEQRIKEFEALVEEMKEETREAHSVLKQIRIERKEIDKIFSKETKQVIEDQVSKVVKTELDKIGPEMRKHTNFIYDKVGLEIDKLITLSLGKEFSTRKGQEDVRPQLALKLREWMREIIEEENN